MLEHPILDAVIFLISKLPPTEELEHRGLSISINMLFKWNLDHEYLFTHFCLISPNSIIVLISSYWNPAVTASYYLSINLIFVTYYLAQRKYLLPQLLPGQHTGLSELFCTKRRNFLLKQRDHWLIKNILVQWQCLIISEYQVIINWECTKLDFFS